MKKVALITGAALGMGFALSRLLALENWMVILTDRNKEQLDAAVKSIIGEGGKCAALPLDVTDHAAVTQVVGDVIRGHGRLDLLIHSAGIAILGEMKDLSIAHWKSIIDVNLWGVINVNDVVYKKMAEQGFGQIVNIASAAGLVPSTMRIPYTTAKHGVVGLSTTLRAEAKKYGVKVNVVCPGLVKTSIIKTVNVIGGSSKSIQSKISNSGKMMTADTAAKHILRGVFRNKPVIPITSSAFIVWWMYRYIPGAYRLFLAKITEKYRELFREDAVAGP